MGATRVGLVGAPSRRAVFCSPRAMFMSARSVSHAVQVEALRRLGEILKAAPKATGGTRGGRPTKLGSKRKPSYETPPTLSELGLSKKTAHVAQRLADLQASQRATGKLLGVDESTVRADLGKRKAGKPAASHPVVANTAAPRAQEIDSAGSPAVPPAWFQADADPSREAKRAPAGGT